jgi:periplasmic copper chaperone A
MKEFRAVFVAAAMVPLGVALATAALAHEYKNSRLEIVHPWTLETDRPMAKVYMKIASKSNEEDRLLSVSSGAAQKATLSGAPDGSIGTAISIPAQGEVRLTRTGRHIVLEGLSARLNAYGRLPLSLIFERAGRMNIEVMVEAVE